MRFEYDKPELAKAIDRLGNVAEQLILAKTNRMIQLSREKEARMVDAYNYMLGEEEGEIAELETVLDGIVDNLEARGIEGINLPDQHKTLAFQEILNSAAEGATELTSAKLENSQIHKENLEGKIREAKKLKRHIDMFDDAVSLVDPGEDKIVDAEDVADAALKWMTANKEEGPAIMQRLERLQTEGELERLQTDYYARLAREAEEKVTAASAGQMDAKIKIETLEPIKKEAQEAVKAMTYQPISRMVEEYGVIISRQAEIDAGDLKTNEVTAAEEQIAGEQARLGSILFPWSYSKEQASVEAQNMQTALIKAVKNGDYYDLINYFKKGNAQYKLLTQQGNPLAETYRADIQAMFGIDISSDNWVSQLIELNGISARIDIEQATEAVKIGRSLLPEVPLDEENREDLLLQQFLEGFLEGGE